MELVVIVLVVVVVVLVFNWDAAIVMTELIVMVVDIVVLSL